MARKDWSHEDQQIWSDTCSQCTEISLDIIFLWGNKHWSLDKIPYGKTRAACIAILQLFEKSIQMRNLVEAPFLPFLLILYSSTLWAWTKLGEGKGKRRQKTHKEANTSNGKGRPRIHIPSQRTLLFPWKSPTVT